MENADTVVTSGEDSGEFYRIQYQVTVYTKRREREICKDDSHTRLPQFKSILRSNLQRV